MITSFLNDKIYITESVKVIDRPSDDEIAEFSGTSSFAPNEKILWLEGQYVEGDVSNLNNQRWSSHEIAIKSLTPRLMPVTIMHEMNTAVGVIADTKLLTPEEHGVDRNTINTRLAIWAHRFPEIAQEIMHNHDQGSLMQSMECDAPAFECSDCGQVFNKPVDETSFCDHLKNGEASRTLLNVTFTGTGLIFGSRGAKGANPKAMLDTAMMEVAKWAESRSETGKTRYVVSKIEIERSEYDELKSRPERAEFDRSIEALESALSDKEVVAARVAELELSLDERDLELAGAKGKLAEIEEEAKSDALAKERLGKVSSKLSEKLSDRMTERLAEAARSLSDEEWAERVTDLTEMAGVKIEAGDEAGDTFSEAAMSSFDTNGSHDSSLGKVDFKDLGQGIYDALK